MYDNPDHLKVREIKVRLDDAAYERLCAKAREERIQRAVLARELVESGLDELQGADVDDHQPRYSLKRTG